LFNTLQLVSYDSKIKSVAELLLDIKEVITTIEDINTTFKDECFAQKPFDELEKQETLLKVFFLSTNLMLRTYYKAKLIVFTTTCSFFPEVFTIRHPSIEFV